MMEGIHYLHPGDKFSMFFIALGEAHHPDQMMGLFYCSAIQKITSIAQVFSTDSVINIRMTK